MIKNLMDKLQNKESAGGTTQQMPQVPVVPQVPAVPIVQAAASSAADANLTNPSQNLSQIQVSDSREPKGGRVTMQDNEEGIIIDLGEGISLNVPIQKRMSLGDFLKVAEKVKALEMLSEEVEYKRNH